MNQRFKNAINRIPQAVPPIWFMRQAGRYHKHYQALRAQHSFAELCRQPELAAQVALGPVAEFDFDVSILFSDILFVLDALGFGLEYTDQGPRLSHCLNESNIDQLRSVDEALPALEFQRAALRATRAVLPKDKSLIGFVGAPWTLFTYAVQGKHDGNLIEAKRQLPLFARMCRTLVPLLKKNIELQFDGGAEVVMIFDTAAGELAPALYHQHIVPVLSDLAQSFPGKLGYYSKFTHFEHLNIPLFHEKGLWSGLGVDHRWNLAKTFRAFKNEGFVQGNFDQSLLFTEGQTFERLLDDYLKPILNLDLEARAGWVCGLGHGVLPKTPEVNVRRFVDRVREVTHSAATR